MIGARGPTLSRAARLRSPARIVNARQFSDAPKENRGAMPNEANVVIIGGGVTGASLLYHLEKLGINACLFEKNEFTSGATWHAAGLVTYFHGGNNFRLWHNYSVDLFKKWQAEGVIHSFHTPGSIRLIEKGNRDRLDEARHHQAKSALYAGLFDCKPMHFITGDEVQKLHPLVDPASLECALYTEGDGHIDPSAVTNAFLNKAKSDFNCKTMFSHTPVTQTTQRQSDGKWEVVVEPEAGVKHCVVADHVINAAGLWCREVGAMADVNIPAVVLQHQYVITESIPKLAELHKQRGCQLPVLRDLAGSFYLRDERDGILIGPYEREQDVVVAGELPKGMHYYLYDGDMERLFPHIEKAAELVPAVGETGIKTVLNGPTCWPADGSHLVGPSNEKKNYWLACAESYGIAHSGGLGQYLAHYIANGEPPYELNETDPGRYGDWAHQDFVTAKVKETYGQNNHVHFPNEIAPAARPVQPHLEKQRDIYDAMTKRGCIWNLANGWEAPVYFDPQSGGAQKGNVDGTWRRPSYLNTHVKRENDGLMNHCGVLYWPFSKYEVTGKDAGKYLDRLVANTLPDGDRVQLCHMLTPTGKVYSEVTAIKTGPESYYLVSYPSMEKFDMRYLTHSVTDNEQVEVKSVSDQWAVLMVNGPATTKVLAGNCEDPEVFEGKWPLFRWKDVNLFGISCRALKVSFIGEHGWELHVPHRHAASLYSQLLGADKDIVDWGGSCMNHLRLEKGIPLFGKDFTKDHSAWEVGLDKFIKLDKEADFVGKEALKKEKATGKKGGNPDGEALRKLIMVEVQGACDLNADCVGNEPLYAGDQVVGFTTSGAWGMNVGKSIAMGYVGPAHAQPDTQLKVELLGKKLTAVVQGQAFMGTWGERQRAAKASGNSM